MSNAPAGYFEIADDELWRAALSQITGCPNAIGAQAASESSGPGNAGRIDWIPTTLAPAKIGYVREDTENVGGIGATFDVCVVASGFGELLKLVKLLTAGVDVCFGPPQGGSDAGGGYEIGKSSAPVRGGVVGSEAWATTIPVTLREPVERRYFPPREILSATAQIDATDGTTTDQAIPDPNGA